MRTSGPAFAVLRIDHFDEVKIERVTVKEIVWTQDEAEREVARMSDVNRDKDCTYFWQYTRAKPRLSDG